MVYIIVSLTFRTLDTLSFHPKVVENLATYEVASFFHVIENRLVRDQSSFRRDR